METQTLRELAKEYAKGALDRESYRRHRTALIDAILAGTVRVEAIDFAAPVVAKVPTDSTSPGKRKRQAEANAAELDELDVFDITQVVPASAEATPPRPQLASAKAATPAPNNANPNLPLLIVGIIAIVAVVGLVVALINIKGDAPTANRGAETPAVNTGNAAGAPESAPAIPAVTTANSATDALAEFLLARSWSDESLEQFQVRWLALPQADRDAAAESGELLQVANAAYRKLQEIRALSQVTDAAATQQKQEKLLAFVNTLGITDSRLAPQTVSNIETPE